MGTHSTLPRLPGQLAHASWAPALDVCTGHLAGPWAPVGPVGYWPCALLGGHLRSTEEGKSLSPWMLALSESKHGASKWQVRAAHTMARK